MKKLLYVYVGAFVFFIAVVGITFAVFTHKSQILGSTFSVGSANIKLLLDLGGPISEENLADSFEGPAFENITSYWEYDYPVKIYNNGTSAVSLTSNSDYETANDPDSLRQLIYVQPIMWNDANGNGLVDEGELAEELERKTIIKWKTEGFDFGLLEQGDVLPIVLRFTTDSVPSTRQGSSAIFDFEFNSMTLEEE